MKYSKQRELILNCVKNSYDHPTADMVYKQVQLEIPNISLGTVYRNLNVLCEHNLIRKIVDQNKIDRFDKVEVNHSHFQCTECESLIDIDVNITSNASSTIEEKTNHKIISHNMVFVGVCNKCR